LVGLSHHGASNQREAACTLCFLWVRGGYSKRGAQSWRGDTSTVTASDALLRPDAGDVSFAPWVFGYRYHSVSTGVRITRLRVGTRRRMYLDSRQYEMIITNMDIKIIIKLIEVNKWGTTHKCFSSQACSGLDCRRNQSSIA